MTNTIINLLGIGPQGSKVSNGWLVI